MAQRRDPRGVSTGGQYVRMEHAEADLGGPLVGPADDLHVGTQYVIHYTVTNEDETEETETAEFVYAGERGPFITSDEGLMIRKDRITKVETDDPYEKALAAHGETSQQIHDACVDKVAAIVRNIEPQAATIGYTRRRVNGSAMRPVAVYTVSNRGEMRRFDADTSKFDGPTVAAINRYLDGIAVSDEDKIRDCEMDLSTGQVDESPPRGRAADVSRVAVTARQIAQSADRLGFSWNRSAGSAEVRLFAEEREILDPEPAGFEIYEKLNRQLAELMENEDQETGHFGFVLATGLVQRI